MEMITSRNLFLMICDTLRMIDERPIQHGAKTAFIFYHMLKCKGGYEEYELADLFLLATLHDIGAYKTENLDNENQYENYDFLSHSIYGYLFMKYLSPLSEMSKILLYHHIGYQQMQDITYKHKELAMYLNLAEKTEHIVAKRGMSFDYQKLAPFVGKEISPGAYDLLERAIKEQDIIRKLVTNEDAEDVQKLLEFILFSDPEKKKYSEMLMFCIGFRSQTSVLDSVKTVCISHEIAKKMNMQKEDREILYYAAMLHDIGMMAIPKDILNAPRKLTSEEREIMMTHVSKGEAVMSNRFHKRVVDVASAHHERFDGSGYPKGLRGGTMSDLQAILQVADTVTGLTSERPYKKAMNKEETCALLTKEANQKRYSKMIVDTFVIYYDQIMSKVDVESQTILTMYTHLNKQLKQIFGGYSTITPRDEEV